MAVNTRSFNGSTDQLTTSLGSLGISFGVGAGSSIGALINFAVLTGFPTVLGINDATNGYGMYLNSSGSPITLSAFTQTTGAGATTGPAISTSSWYFAIATKTTGSVLFRTHVYDCTAGTWTHANATTNCADSTISAAGMRFANGAANANPMSGKVYLGAVWNTALSDSTCATLTSDSAVIASSPIDLWFFDQGGIGTNVPDYTGHGADQTAITGTSVSSDTIPNYDATHSPAAAAALVRPQFIFLRKNK
jgi:hypothetical protein